MEIREHISLKPYNTFGIEAKARYFIEINDLDTLKQALGLQGYPPPFILSGGSNILITGDVDALVLYINLKGISLLREDQDRVFLRVMAGEIWHELVLWALERDYGGLENLSMIPGRTGTAPIQNIGAYGVELKDVFESCTAIDIQSRELHTFSARACAFGYRDSYFKQEGKGRYIITSVDLRLSKGKHRLNTSYGAIEAELRKRGCSNPGIKDVSEAVIAIRRSKLPDPKELGNSGSFFKNPVIGKSACEQLLAAYPEAPVYNISAQEFKVPAGWMIEQCGMKGRRYGDAGVHIKQALVLVNYGKASGKELLDLAKKIQEEVFRKFRIRIEPEVNIIGPGI